MNDETELIKSPETTKRKKGIVIGSGDSSITFEQLCILNDEAAKIKSEAEFVEINKKAKAVTKETKTEKPAAKKEKVELGLVDLDNKEVLAALIEEMDEFEKKEKEVENVHVDNKATEPENKPKRTLRKVTAASIFNNVKIISLGGLGEIGKNITLFETAKDIIVVDCGISFPGTNMPGVDILLPDLTYLFDNAHKVKGIIITHAHEDHIGGIPYLLKTIKAPVYATRLTAGVLRHKLDENGLTTKVNIVKSGTDVIKLGDFEVEFIKVNHSIPGAVALAINTPVGVIFHTGDFKIDTTPVNSTMIDLTRIGEIGKQGVKLLLADSTNAEREGWTLSEKKVAVEMLNLFTKYKKNRITVATFSSNIYRLQSVIDAAIANGRKIAVTGRSLLNVFDVSVQLGYINAPENSVIPIEEVAMYPDEEVAILTTGSQGEAMSVLNRIANDEHKHVSFDENDVVILSSHTIPGNEKVVNNITNKLAEKGVLVINDSVAQVHVSGHACKEELKLLHALLKPEFFMPIHGEKKHLLAHEKIAEEVGTPKKNILLTNIGAVNELTEDSLKVTGKVVSGIVMIDNNSYGTMTSINSFVLKDRRTLSNDGFVVISCAINMVSKTVTGKCEIATRGLVTVRDYETMFKKIKAQANKDLENGLAMTQISWETIKSDIRESASKIIYNETKKNPIILVSIINTH